MFDRLCRILCGLFFMISMISATSCSGDDQDKPMDPSHGLRPEIKQYLDELRNYSVTSLAHTTDSLPSKMEYRFPESPSQFPAGRFKAVFTRSGQTRAILVQTEEKVPHFTTITPGTTDIGGYVQLFSDPTIENPDGATLNLSEIDYLIQIVYTGFCRPLDTVSATTHNQLKDRLLAIRFSSKPGIRQYHGRLADQLKSGYLCNKPL